MFISVELTTDNIKQKMVQAVTNSPVVEEFNLEKINYMLIQHLSDLELSPERLKKAHLF